MAASVIFMAANDCFTNKIFPTFGKTGLSFRGEFR